MIHTQDLEMLYNTLKDVETKGESTKVMADCLRFIERKIRESQQEPVTPPVPPMPEPTPTPVPEPMPKPRKKRRHGDTEAEVVVDTPDSDLAAEDC